MNWTERYRQSHNRWCKRKSPGFFEASGGESMKVAYPKVTSTNGLRRAIINYMLWEGNHCEATNTMGRPIQKFAPKFSIMSGKVEQVPTRLQWQKGAGTPGSSDAKGHINHPNQPKFAIPLYIEIKYGKDRMSDAQKDYEQLVNDTGGLYIVAKTIQGFFEWYDEFMENSL